MSLMRDACVLQEPPRFLPQYRNPCYVRGAGALRCAPHFMLIGVQKCGTTDLYDKMMIHPNISRARTKEPFWWNRGRFRKSRTHSVTHSVTHALSHALSHARTQSRTHSVTHALRHAFSKSRTQ
jgi:hypothetical protein